ncbi:MAG TPA: hypothetical protein VMS38_12660 [Pseudorhodoferax sp.]|nr:hypothetical protein [Pseudorhodoferax sp.]
MLALHGDSLEDGTAPWGKLEVIPGQRLAELLPGWIVRDYASAAETLPEAYGETVYVGGKPLQAGRLKYDPMPEHIAASDATHMFFRYGGADCLLGTPLPRFSELRTRTVELAQARNKTVLLAGVYDHPHWGFTAYTDAAREVSARTGATWIEMPAIRYPEDLTDDLHPTQEMSDRWCQAIAEAVRAAA